MVQRFPINPADGTVVKTDSEWDYIYYENLGTSGSGAWRKVGIIIEEDGSSIDPADRESIENFLNSFFWTYLPMDWFEIGSESCVAISGSYTSQVYPGIVDTWDNTYLTFTNFEIITTDIASTGVHSNFLVSEPDSSWKTWCGGGYSQFEVNTS